MVAATDSAIEINAFMTDMLLERHEVTPRRISPSALFFASLPAAPATRAYGIACLWLYRRSGALEKTVQPRVDNLRRNAAMARY
jgi:hypothetical protein